MDGEPTALVGRPRERRWLWVLRILSVPPLLFTGTVGVLLLTEFVRSSHVRKPGWWLYFALVLIFSVSGCLPYALTLWFARGGVLRPAGTAAALASTSFWCALCGLLTLEPLIDRADIASHGHDELGFVIASLVILALVVFYHLLFAWVSLRASTWAQDASEDVADSTFSLERLVGVVRASALVLALLLLTPNLLLARTLSHLLPPLGLFALGALAVLAAAPYLYVFRDY